MAQVSILGYGRFGEALTGLCAKAGQDVRAWDPHRAIPEPLRLCGPEGVAARPGLVVLAVPVPAMEAVLLELRTHLSADHLVLDVGSVKVRPIETLRRVLGRHIPWAATHPLFGPVSLAKGEGPLRVALCPGGLHPDAEDLAQSFWEGLGCEVHRQDAHDHDRDMASTHALSFFLAKGLGDAGAGEGVTHAPPSFEALARGMELVRSDAGHLFRVLHLENPYAPAARKRLLEALLAVDRDLDAEDQRARRKAASASGYSRISSA